jgi:hypothetical protein
MLTATDANGNQVSATYSDNWYWRPASSKDAASNTTSYTYTVTSTESNLAFNGGNSASDILATVDGFGRILAVQARETPSSSNWDTSSYSYDGDGRLATQSLPYVGSKGTVTSGKPGTAYTYDALSRVRGCPGDS